MGERQTFGTPPLRDEMAFVDDYLSIEVIRFGRQKLKIVKEIDTPGPAPPYDPKGAALPPDLMPSEPKKKTESGDKNKKPSDDAPANESTDDPADEAK